ncbi:MAG TPA: glycosyltransferase family 4 protein [Luteitalea sp.]|nr:glycosyltransferase family 4 protein [Luteitalea sp.]
MKILYHHRTLGDGAEGIHVAEMVRAFRTLGHEVRLLSLIGETTNVATPKQQRWTAVRRMLPGAAYELAEIGYNVAGYLAVSKAIAEFKPDLVYDRYVNYNYSAVAAARRARLPVFVEVNSPYSYQKQTFDERLYLAGVSRRFERTICSKASRVIVVSTPLKKFLVSIGVPAERVVVMPNGADPDAFTPSFDAGPVRQRLGVADAIVVGFSGILRPWHGLDLLVESFARLAGADPRLHLLIVGDGPIRPELEQQIAARGLTSRVTITGRLPHAQVREYVAAMDVAVSPRATFYASPMKVLEYMAMGKAIVAPDMDNLRDILTDGQDGVLFTAENVDALTAALDRLVRDDALRRALGLASRRKIEDERTWLHNAREVVRMYEQVVRPGGR